MQYSQVRQYLRKGHKCGLFHYENYNKPTEVVNEKIIKMVPRKRISLSKDYDPYVSLLKKLLKMELKLSIAEKELLFNLEKGPNFFNSFNTTKKKNNEIN